MSLLEKKRSLKSTTNVFHPKSLDTEEQTEPEVKGRKEMIKMRM